MVDIIAQLKIVPPQSNAVQYCTNYGGPAHNCPKGSLCTFEGTQNPSETLQKHRWALSRIFVMNNFGPISDSVGYRNLRYCTEDGKSDIILIIGLNLKKSIFDI